MAPCDEVNLCVSNATSPAKMVNSEEGVVSEVASEKSHKGQSPNMKIQGLESNKEVTMPSIISQKTSEGPNNADIEMQSDKGYVSSVKPEKVSQSSCTRALALLPGQEGRTGHEVSIHSVVRASDDGYNWRKYGQKNVKGNEYIRSYYKCTYRTCQVKRQVERSHDGQITDIVYFGQHDHPKPQANLPLAVGFVVSIVEDRSSEPSVTSADKLCNVDVKTPNKIEHKAVATSESAKSVLAQSNRRRDEIDNNDAPYTKRQKKDNLDAKSVDKSTPEQRVVKTVSEVDSVNDGYRWRKYGQKLVKGNPNPRSYYRCSSPGCPAKKHVERASHDPKMVIATYEGQHGHEIPPGRTITHNTVGQNNQTVVAMDGETDTKSRENNTVCLDMAVQAGSEPHGKPPGSTGAHNTVEENNQTSLQAGESKSDEQQNGESGSKSEVCDVVSPNVAVQSSLDSGSQPIKEKNIESGAKSEETATDTEGPEGRSKGQSNVTPGPASISKEQQLLNVEAVPMVGEP